FVFHKLALASVVNGRKSPIWLADNRIAAVAGASIDRARVEFDRGEMSFGLFSYTAAMDDIVAGSSSSLDKLDALRLAVGDSGFPEYLLKFIKRVCPDGATSVEVHKSQLISDSYQGADTERIERRKGFLGSTQLKGANPKALHHLRIIRNNKGAARLFYKFEGSIQFIKNLRTDA